MLTKKRIFLASGADLFKERDAVELIIQRKNAELIEKNIFLEVVRWEQLRQDFGEKGAQEHYSSEINESDIVIILFYKKVGKYTKQEFDIAYNLFKEGQKPRHLYAYFKKWMVPSDQIDDDIIAVRKLRTDISNDEQIFIDFESIPELQYSVSQQLDLLIKKFVYEDGEISIDTEKLEKEALEISNYNNEGPIITDRNETEQIAKHCGMFTRWHVNAHLKFQDGDISYFTGKFNAFELEQQFRARRLILDKADKIKLRIDEPGKKKKKSKRIEALLFDMISKKDNGYRDRTPHH